MNDSNVPVGYKNTEVDIIPEDWSIASINDCSVKIGSGKTPTGGSSVYVNSGRPFIRSQNVGWGKLKLSDVAYITEEIHSSFLGSEIEESDVLLNITGASIGRCTKADTRISGGNVNQHVCIIRTDNTKLIPNLLVDLINSNSGQKQIDSYQAGGNREGLNFSQVRQLKFAIATSIEEQTAIATTLSDVDNLIQSLERLVSKKEAIKTASMQQLLTGKTRLPEFATREDGSRKGFKQTDLGQIPEDWELLSVRETCDLLTGFPFPSSKYQEAGIKLLRGSNVKRGNTDWSDNITKFWAESTSGIEQYLLQKADVVISMDGSLVGRSFAQLSDSDLPALLLQRVARLRAKLISQNYLKEWICSPIFSDYCDSVKTVTAIPHISPADILNFRLFTPQSKKEQIAIATILSDMDAEIQALHTRLTKTQDIKQGMMQQLLTGKLRLPH